MNTYRINYSVGSNEVESTEFTERNEVSARKMFKAFSKSGTITSIELIRENVCASKQQERDTLAAIIQMVEELGPQSYLKTAFAGCFEDAEQNIEDDSAFSMKDRYEIELKKKEELDDKNRLLQETINRLQREAELMEARSDLLEKRVLTADDLGAFIAVVHARTNEHEQKMKSAAESIVELAGNTDSREFQQAVSEHREAKRAMERFAGISERLNDIVAAGA